MSATTSCEIIRPLLSVYIDEEATAAEAERVKSHLAHCARCASELAFLRLSHEALSHPSIAAVPPSLHERIAMATYARPTLSARIAAWLSPAPARLALGGAAMAAVVAVAYVLRTPDVSQQPTGSGQVAKQTEAPQSSNPSEPAPALPPTTIESPRKRVDVAAANTAKKPERSNPAAVTAIKPSSTQVAVTEAPPRPLNPAKRAETVTRQAARNEASEPVKAPKSSQQRPLIIAKVTPAPASPVITAATPSRVQKTAAQQRRRQPVEDITPSAPEPQRKETAPNVRPEPVVVAAAPPAPVTATETRPVQGGLSADGRFRRRVDSNRSMMAVAYVENQRGASRRRDFGTGPGYTGELGQGSRMDRGVVELPVD